MDEAALRAMLPMGFGKAASRGRGQAAPASAPAPPAAPKGVKRPADDSDGDGDDGERGKATDKKEAKRGDEVEVDEDGLTAEERAANEALLARRGAGDSDDEDDDSDDDSDADLGPEPPSGPAAGGSLRSAAPPPIPLDHEALLFSPPSSLDVSSSSASAGPRPLTALSMDSSGARVATGGMDYRIQLWDFGGMARGLRPLASVEPFGSYFITDLAFSGNGERLLAVSGTAQPKLLDRNGVEIATYKKGDPYLRDMKQTKGHVAEVTSCSWVPSGNGRETTFATTSADSTVRLWDPEVPLSQKTVIPVRSKERGGRTRVCTHAFSPDGGRSLAAGCSDGALHLWSTAGSFSRPNASREAAHVPGNDITSLAWSRDAKTLASRSTDGSLKLWDVRALKQPLAEVQGLETAYGTTSVEWSPDGERVLTGSERGLHVFERRTLAEVQVIRPEDPEDDDGANEVSPAGAGKPTPSPAVIRAHWHPRLNQLLATTSRGSTSIFYSPTSSTRGVLLVDPRFLSISSSRARARARAREGAFDPATFDGPIITPGAGGSQGQGQGSGTSEAAKRRRLAKMRADPAASQIPQRPLSGPGRGGRIGAAAMRGAVQEFVRDNTREEDPREALLKYAEVSQREPKYTKAWDRAGGEGDQGEEED